MTEFNTVMQKLYGFKYTDKIVWSLIWLVLYLVVINLFNRILFRTIKDNKTYHQVKKPVNYSLTFLLVIIMLMLWMESSQSIITYAGLLSAGIAIALKELFSNMAGWVFIATRKPFKPGDRILIAGQKGDVIDVRIFQFSLMEVSDENLGEQSTGRIIDVPNYYILLHPLVNYTKGFEYIWNEINVLLTFESDWRQAKDSLNNLIHSKSFQDIAEVDAQIREAAKTYMIHYSNLSPIIYTNVRDSGVELTIRYLCGPKQKRQTINTIWEEILGLVEGNKDIELAYPTRRVLNY